MIFEDIKFDSGMFHHSGPAIDTLQLYRPINQKRNNRHLQAKMHLLSKTFPHIATKGIQKKKKKDEICCVCEQKTSGDIEKYALFYIINRSYDTWMYRESFHHGFQLKM